MERFEKYISDHKEETAKQAKAGGLEETVLAAKRAYIEHEEQGRLTYLEFLYMQAQYLEKRWWLLQAGLLGFLWLFLRTTDSGMYMQRGMGVTASLFGLLILPELWKNKSCCAMEIEGTAYYPLRQIYAARILLFSIADVFLLLLFFAAAGTGGCRIDMQMFLTDFFLPYSVTCCICFWTLLSPFIASQYTAVFFSLLWTFIWVLVLLQERIYQAVILPAWGGLVVFSAVCLIYGLERVLKSDLTVYERESLI